MNTFLKFKIFIWFDVFKNQKKQHNNMICVSLLRWFVFHFFMTVQCSEFIQMQFCFIHDESVSLQYRLWEPKHNVHSSSNNQCQLSFQSGSSPTSVSPTAHSGKNLHIYKVLHNWPFFLLLRKCNKKKTTLSYSEITFTLKSFSQISTKWEKIPLKLYWHFLIIFT